jgi:hypothetical protein
MIMLSIELTEETENGEVGVAVKVGVTVDSGVSVAGMKFAGVKVAGGVMDGLNVAVGGISTVAVGVHVGSS